MDKENRADIIKILAKNMRARRKALGLTQEQVSKKAEIHINYYGDIERCLRNPSILNIDRIAAALNVPTAMLFMQDVN